MWIHSYSELTFETIEFIKSSNYEELFLYSDGLKNRTSCYPAEKINNDILCKNDKYAKVSKFVYFGWINEMKSKEIESYIFNKEIFVNNLNFFIEQIALKFNYKKYIESINLEDCSDDDLVIFGRYYSIFEVYRFKDKKNLEDLQKALLNF